MNIRTNPMQGPMRFTERRDLKRKMKGDAGHSRRSSESNLSKMSHDLFRTANNHSSIDSAPKRSRLLQIFHQILDVVEIPPKQRLLLPGRPRNTTPSAVPTTGAVDTPRGRAREPARVPLRRVGRAGPGARDRRGLGHQVEVQELDQLELDLAGRGALLEQRGDGEQAVERLEGARVGGAVQQGRDEGEQRGGLDGGAVAGVEEVQEEVHVDLAGEEGAGGRVQQEDALDQVERGDDEEVVGAAAGPAEQVFETRYEAQGDC